MVQWLRRRSHKPESAGSSPACASMLLLLVLLLLCLILAGAGFALHPLWWVLAVAVICLIAAAVLRR